MAEPARYVTEEDRSACVPVYAVWEITLACDLKCQHCGSRAGRRRPDELSTEECLDLVRQMARLGTREVTIIGGEAYLRRDWLAIIREIRAQGMNCTLQSGGLHLTEERILQAKDAGLQTAGVSIDGPRELHDRLRGVKGSFDAALSALRLLKRHGLRPSVNTQVTSEVVPHLRDLLRLFVEAGAEDWQVQLTVAMGRAADHPELLLQPYELLEVMPLLAELYEEGLEHGLLLQAGNNIGYFGPHEATLRSKGDDRVHWSSCNAGQNTIGIEADGAIKGCPSLPTRPFTGANIRDLTLEDIWRATPELSFTRTRGTDDLWGFCRTCYYADVCRGGCTWTSHVLFGRSGNNPYCHHRALELQRRGLRERVALVAPAPGTPFDHGEFELVLETSDGRPITEAEDGSPAIPLGAKPLVQISSARKRPTPAFKTPAQTFAAPEELIICRGCNRHVFPGTTECPHCGGDVRAHERAHKRRAREARKAYEELLKLLPTV
jgi:Y-X(10)_GDL-associated radical SAM protein